MSRFSGRKRAGFRLVLVLLVAGLLPAACRGFDLSGMRSLIPAGVSVESTPAPVFVPSESPFDSSVETGVETPVLMCTPPACGPGEVYDCPGGDCPGGCGTICAVPTIAPEALAAAPADWEALEGWLAAQWRGGVNPAAVRAALQAAGLQKGYNDWWAADFDGDLRDEWVLVLYDPTMPAVPWGYAGDLWIVNEQGPVFRYYVAPSTDIFEFTAPAVIGIADLTGDGLPELIADARVCGAHTCYGNYRIIGHTPDGYGDRIQTTGTGEGYAGNTITISAPEARLADMDGDGRVEFVVSGGSIGSAGAGVVRTRTEIWRWDGSTVSLAETILDPTGYRHHILYEANDWMAAGNLEKALALYEAAINDGALRDDGYVHAPPDTYSAISQFAAFRLILIDLLRGAPVRASERLAWLQATYPGTAAAQAAALLVANWSGPDNLAGVCAVVERAMSSWDNPTGPLADMGYGNPALSAADYCP